MIGLTLFGVVAVASMLVFYSLEPRHASFVLLFAIACLASSIYGFLQGAWPFGIVELIWSGVAVDRWQKRTADAESATSRPIACDMSAFSPTERAEYQVIRRHVLANVETAVETPMGFRARLKSGAAAEAAQWLLLELRCCPFLNAGLDVTAGGEVWLRLEGPPAAKVFLREEFGQLVSS